MEFLKELLLGLLGIALLYFGAEYLIRGGVNIAKKLGVSPLLIGLTLVAFGTSAPELVVSIEATLRGTGDIAIGNVVGSNICNIALILGLCALLKPIAVNGKIFKLDMPLMIGGTLLFLLFYFVDGYGINRWQGAVMVAILLIYLIWSFRTGKVNSDELDENGTVRIPLALLMAAGGLASLIFGAKCFVGSAVFFARLWGISEAVIGLTIVALGTSLPELATSVVAVLRGERDIAIGNIVGSNIFNILVIMGIAPLVRPVIAPELSFIDAGVMLFTAVVLFPIMWTGKRISRCEGAFLLLIYLVYTLWLFAAGRY